VTFPQGDAKEASPKSFLVAGFKSWWPPRPLFDLYQELRTHVHVLCDPGSTLSGLQKDFVRHLHMYVLPFSRALWICKIVGSASFLGPVVIYVLFLPEQNAVWPRVLLFDPAFWILFNFYCIRTSLCSWPTFWDILRSGGLFTLGRKTRMHKLHLKCHELLFSRTAKFNYPASVGLNH